MWSYQLVRFAHHFYTGLTQLNPNFDVFGIKGLPQYACPDLSNRGTSWVFPITDPCGSAQRHSRRLRKERYPNGVKIPDRCYIDDVNDDDDDEDDSDSDYEVKSSGMCTMIISFE